MAARRLTLLTLALCALCHAQAVTSSIDDAKTGYACEGSTLKIECAPGNKIHVIRANYGRFSRAVCYEGSNTEEWDLQCMSMRSLRVVVDLCVGKTICWVAVTNRMFGDPCRNTPKYLEVQYQCQEDESEPIAHPTRPITTTTTTPSTTTSITTTPSTPPSKPAPVQPEKRFCEEIKIRNVTWPQTLGGEVVYMPCPNNPSKNAMYYCMRSPVMWQGKPDFSLCVSEKIIKVKEKIRELTTEEVVEEVVMVTDEVQFGGDVTAMTDIMQELADQVQEEVHTNVYQDQRHQAQAVEKVNKAVVKAGSNLLSENQVESWKDLPQADQAAAATKLVSSVEKSAFTVADTVTLPTVQPIINVEVNIVMEVNIVATDKAVVSDVVFPDPHDQASKEWSSGSGDFIRLSGKTIKKFGVDGLAKLIFLSYHNLEHLLNPQQDSPNEVVKVSENGHDDYSQNDKGTESADDKGYKKNEQDIEAENDKEKKIKVSENGHDESENEIPTEEVKPKTIVNSNIISASINNREEKMELPEPIYYTLEHKTQENVYNPSCSFWEYSERTMDGKWSDFGCRVAETNVTHTVCECNHLTNFAVLMDVTGVSLARHHLLTLSVITYIGCIISIVCLFLAWITFQFCKNLQCDRNTIHKNLVFCLFLAEVVFLCGITQYDKPVLCSFIAIFLHYFFLASFAWMCLEGVQLYVMLIEVFEAERSRRKYYYLAAYGIPAIIVGISAAVDFKGYGTEEYCWLNTQTGFIWAFVGPVMAVITVNVVMLSIAIYMMCKHASIAAQLKMKEKSRLEKIRSWVKGAFVLVVLLGLTWAFGLLYVSAHTVAMAYIFTIFNSLQGLFIFLFHCAMNEKVQKEYKRWVRHATWLPECIRVNYGGASYASSTPNTSSSGGNYFQKLWSGRKRKRSSLTSIPRSSTPNGKWSFPNMKAEYMNSSSGGEVANQQSLLQSGQEMAAEDPNNSGYLEPVKLNMDVENDYASIDGNLSQVVDASVIDSEAITDYINQGGLSINVEKYKINPNRSSNSQDYYDGPSKATLARAAEKERMLEEYRNNPFGGEETPEKNLNNSSSEESIKKRLSDLESGHNSLNDLNKDMEGQSHKSLNISTPNINYKSATLKSNINNEEQMPMLDKDSSHQRSMPNLFDEDNVAMNKIKKALSQDGDGLISLYHGKKSENRLSKDTQDAMKSHRVRLTSSDC